MCTESRVNLKHRGVWPQNLHSQFSKQFLQVHYQCNQHGRHRWEPAAPASCHEMLCGLHQHQTFLRRLSAHCPHSIKEEIQSRAGKPRMAPRPNSDPTPKPAAASTNAACSSLLLWCQPLRRALGKVLLFHPACLAAAE